MIPKTMVMSVQVVLICALFLAGAGCTHASPQADITRAEMKTVPVGDITIAYKEVGSGEPLVLIMGYSGTMDLWDPRVVNQLAEQYRVIIFDNRGMGHTTSSDKEYSIRLFADDTAGLMDALKIEKADVMGFSMGTNIAQELTLDYPEKVDKLILYAGDPGGKEALSPAPQDLESIQNTTGTDRERGERLFKEMFPPVWLKENPDPSKYFPNVTSMSPAENVRRQVHGDDDMERFLLPAPDMEQPLLLITGDQDLLTPPGNSLIIAGKVPQSWVVRMRGGGHGVMSQYPDAFASIVLTFLSYGT